MTFIPHLPDPGKDAPVLREERHVGGEACNIAMALAKWGVSVAIGGNVVGDDEAGDFILDRLREAGVDVSAVGRCANQPTPYCRVLVLPDGERYILSYGHEGIRFTLPLERWTREAKILVTDRFGGKLRDTLVRQARARGITTVSLDAIDSNDPRRDNSDLIVSSMSVVHGSFVRAISSSICYVTELLHEVTEATVVITDGPNPTCAFTDSREKIEVPPYPVPNPIDTTGAGDVFAAGITYGTLRGWTLARSVDFAMAAAALTVQRAGADVPPSLEEIEELRTGR